MKPVYLSNSDLISSVDDVDYLDICFFSFSLNNGYARRGDKKYLHSIIAQKINLIGEIDHIDRNRLNNCRNNLRVVTSSQNKWNSSSHKQSYSIYKGVTLDTKDGKWVAQIHYQNINHYLGRFIYDFEAALAYNEAALKYFGEFAALNEI